MSTPKRYLHDRLVLLLLTANTFVAVLTSILILLKLDSARLNGYIVEYRANRGLSAFKTGNSGEILAFMLFAVFILVFNSVLSVRVYHIRRYFSIAILAMTLLLLVMTLIVSNALLVLR